MAIPRKMIGLTLLTVLIVFILFAISWVEMGRAKVQSKVAKVKNNMWNTLHTAIESYYVDHCIYPAPDIDENGNYILPHFLTTPIAYAACGSSQARPVTFVTDCDVVHDPFNYNGKGIYGYGGGPIRSDQKVTSPSAGYIITSYGPDRVPGNTGIPGGKPIDPTKAWTDCYNPFDDTIYPSGNYVSGLLKSSSLTYDPTNGLISSGDIWQRGP